MKKIVPFLFLALFALGCASRKERPVHIECAVLYFGKIKRMERVGIADTAAAFVSIKTRDEKTLEDLSFVMYRFTRLGDSEQYQGMADVNGTFNMALPVGSYSFQVLYPGYHDLPSNEIALKEGEMWEMETILAEKEPVIKHKMPKRHRRLTKDGTITRRPVPKKE